MSLFWPAERLMQLLGDARERPLSGALAALGTLWAAQQLYNVASFAYTHTLRRSTISQYKGAGPNAAWALVTGASDGIGKGFVEELCQRGFNVVLHGRNEAKLNRLKDDLLKQWPKRELRILIVDAANDARNSAKLESAARSLDDIDLRVLINNVGGDVGSTTWSTLAERTEIEVSKYIDVNATFPTQLTRVLLPLLVRQPSSLIINIGSGASELGLPYLSVYSGSKGFDKSWSHSLHNEMKAEGNKVEVLFIMVGACSTPNLVDLEPSFFVPDGRQMANSSLEAVGCGYTSIWAFWPHALQFAVMARLPGRIVRNLMVDLGRKERAKEQERLKRQ